MPKVSDFQYINKELNSHNYSVTMLLDLFHIQNSVLSMYLRMRLDLDTHHKHGVKRLCTGCSHLDSDMTEHCQLLIQKCDGCDISFSIYHVTKPGLDVGAESL